MHAEKDSELISQMAMESAEFDLYFSGNASK